MAVTVVDTSQQLFDYRQRVAFDGTTFELRFRWNTRMQAWFMDVLDEDRNTVVYARRCIIEWTMLRQSRHVDGAPAGELINIDTTQRDVPPTLEDFGTRVLMMYLDAEEIAAV